MMEAMELVAQSNDSEARRKTGLRRHDMYRPVHKGLRSMMCDVLVRVGRLDAGDDVEVAATAACVRDMLGLCRSHLHHENQFIHAAMESRRRGSSATTARDHLHHEKSIEALEGRLRVLEHGNREARQEVAQALYRDLALFVADNFQHMDVEETANNAELWETHADEELAAVHDALVASIPPEKMLVYLRWMVPAMAPEERVELFAGIRQNLPAEAFVGVLAAAKPGLAERDWHKLMAALGELPLAA